MIDYKYLYKFVDIDTLHKIFVSGCLYFSSPKNFNDPFDCEAEVDFNNTYEELFEFFMDLRNDKNNARKELHEVFSHIKHKDKNKSEKEVISSIAKDCAENPDLLLPRIHEGFEEVRNSLGLSCFSQCYKNILMWSHYADKHKGVCLKFVPYLDQNLFEIMVPVEYDNNFLSYNYVKDRKNLRQILIGTKSKDWEYENEVRVMKKKQGLYPFKPASLIEIIFGLKTEDQHKMIIEKFKKETNYKHIIISQIEKVKDKFELRIKATNCKVSPRCWVK